VKTFPAVLFVSRHGRRLALVVGVVLAVAGLACFIVSREPMGLVGGLVSASVAWASLRLVAELVEVVAETLLPR
jgi:hypothetical protein